MRSNGVLTRMVRLLRGEEHGQGLVELAITLSILLLLVLGGAELSRLIHVFLVATNAARDGARTAAIGYDYSQVAAEVDRSLGAWGEKTHTIEITPSQDERRSGQSIQVRVIVPVPLMTPILSEILSNPFPVNSAVTMRAE